jgi:predicted amidophosphoribosyltransferase
MPNLIKIDELFRPQHRYLTDEDECFYFLTYHSYHRHGRTPENVLIMDFKIDMDKKGTAMWQAKINATNTISQMLENSLPEISTPESLFVPMPPSKIKIDPLYDDRICAVLRNFCNKQAKSDLRELISIKRSWVASHKSSKKYTPQEFLENLTIDKKQCEEKKTDIILMDDVLSTGAQFKACQQLLKTEFPNSTIKGLFIARAPLS